jgi:O-antigen/teichoic acid export membrane protein
MAGGMFNSAVIVVAMRWTDRLVGLISTLVLARLLVPDDFGIVAMASLTVGLVDALLDIGVAAALIHKRGFDQDDFSTAWTIRLIQSALVALIIALAAPFVADYFNDVRVKPVLWLMACTFMLQGLENIGIVSFQKEMKFNRDFQFFFVRRVSGVLVTVVLAFWTRSYWALPIGSLVGKLTGVWLSYAMHSFRPKFTLLRLRTLWSFSQWMLVRSVGIYVDGRFDRLLIGGRADAAVMGAYTLADEIAAMPSTELLAPIGRVLFPALVDARERPAQMRQIYLLALALQAMLAIPAAAGLALVARDAVVVLLGERWISAVSFVQVLALIYGGIAVSHAAGYLLLALGRIRAIALLIWFQIGLFGIGAVMVFPHAGALDLARLRLAVTAIGTVCFLAVVLRQVRTLRARDIFAVTWRPFAAAAVMAAAVSPDSLNALPALAALVLKCLIGAVAYSATLLVLWTLSGRPGGGESYALAKVAHLVRRR